MLSEGSLRGMRKRSLGWLSMARSVAADVPREYRLIGAFGSVLVLGGRRRQSKGRRERQFGPVGGAWPVQGMEGGGGGTVGWWESGKLDATGRRLFVSLLDERRKWRERRN